MNITEAKLDEIRDAGRTASFYLESPEVVAVTAPVTRSRSIAHLSQVDAYLTEDVLPVAERERYGRMKKKDVETVARVLEKAASILANPRAGRVPYVAVQPRDHAKQLEKIAKYLRRK